MKLAITTDIEVEAPETGGYVTWLDVRILDDDGSAHGTARIAIVHVGEIADALGDVWPALHGTALEGLHDVYFTQGWYRDEFCDGAGIDLLVVSRVELTDDARARNLDLAVVRRLCDTIGSGCQLAVRSYADAADAAHWSRLGFAISTPGRTSGFMHMNLGYRHARVVDATGAGDYEVVTSGTETTRIAMRGTQN